MELSVLNIKGEDTGRKVTLNDAIFGIEPNDHAIYLDVKQYLANQRQGTHKSKERSEVSGSTRKLIRQKGGGGARRGDINSPVLVGGGRVFGPKPRDYEFKLNKKVKGLARKSALTYKAKNNAIVVVEDFTLEAPKTKEFVTIAKNLKVADGKLLLVLSEKNNFVYLSARNLEKANVITASELNTYSVLNAVNLVLTESYVAVIEKPIVTEKQTAITEKMDNRYGFRVSPDANKLEIKKAIEDMYNVTVVDVNTINYSGKKKSRYTKSGIINGKQSAFKKAIVTLKEGETIDFFSNI